MAKGWIVNRLDVENLVDAYAKVKEEIEFTLFYTTDCSDIICVRRNELI